MYVWGNGSNGEIGNYATSSTNLPIKTTIENAIQASIGDGHVGVLTSDGVVWCWGKNTHGQLGINCTNNTSYPMKTALSVTELSLGGYHTTVKKINGTAYATGCYSEGRLGTGSTANITKYAAVKLPSTVTKNVEIQEIIPAYPMILAQPNTPSIVQIVLDIRFTVAVNTLTKSLTEHF